MIEQRDRDHANHLRKKSDQITVFVNRDDARCEHCDGLIDTGWLTFHDGKASCLQCAGIGELEFLPSGDTALTRRASKLSSKRAIVLKWSRARKRYVRQGTLVEAQAIKEAQRQCAADAQERERKNARAAIRREADDQAYKAAFLAELTRLFPGCPPEEARQIAMHACEKSSGRVGRTAAAKQLEAKMIRLAVIAHIRHVHTGYDDFLTAFRMRKRDARAKVQGKIERVLAQWEKPTA